jgi:menaquinone-dependent protoporphyrinogen IX oxidase
MAKNKTLIAYETKQGATREAAKKIADVLRTKHQLDVDLFDLKDKEMPSFQIYTNVIVGAGVRGGRVYGKALKFLKNDFSKKRVAFFISSSWAGTPGSHDNAKARLVDKTLTKYPSLSIESSEAFGGRIRYFNRTMLDNTDMAKVETWAEELGKRFTQ